MKDFKKMPKMACGGGVKKYETGGGVKSDSPKKLSLLDQNSEWVKQNYPDFHKALTEAVAQDGGKAPKSPRTGGGGASSSGGTASDTKQLVNPRAMKSGGKVKRGNKKK